MSTRTRTLLVSTYFPDDPQLRVTGAHKRLGLFVDALKQLGSLDCLFFVDPGIDRSPDALARHRDRLAEYYDAELELTLVEREFPRGAASRWELYGAPVLDGFRHRNFCWWSGSRQRAAFEAALERRPDRVFVHRLTSMPPVLGTGRELPPVYFDLDDIEHRAFARSIPQPPRWPAKRLFYLQVPALWWAERRAVSRARRTFVCSEIDRRYLRRTMAVGGIEVVPNAVSVPEPRPLPQEPVALFLGNLGYPPNRNAAVRLLEDIWPRVREQMPDARLVIAGPHAQSVPGHDTPGRGVEFPGFVADLDALYAATRVVCAPIEAGGGTRLKIIEAAAHGRPVVSTPIGAEGLELAADREIVIRRDVKGLAEAIVDLLRDRERAIGIGRAAHEAVRETHEHDRIVGRVRRMIESAEV